MTELGVVAADAAADDALDVALQDVLDPQNIARVEITELGVQTDAEAEDALDPQNLATVEMTELGVVAADAAAEDALDVALEDVLGAGCCSRRCPRSSELSNSRDDRAWCGCGRCSS